jgi:hypothetical protein
VAYSSCGTEGPLRSTTTNRASPASVRTVSVYVRSSGRANSKIMGRYPACRRHPPTARRTSSPPPPNLPRTSTPRLVTESRVYTKAPPIIRAFDEGAVNPEPARALSRHPDRERATEGNRRQADQPEHLPPAQLRAAPVGAWIQRTVAPCGGRLARLVQQANRRAPRLSASDRSGPAQRPRPDHGRDVSAAAAGETAQAPRRRSCGGALVEAAAGADRAAVRSE